MKINPNCVLRRLGKQNMVVKADGKNSNMSQVYIFNDTATYLWNTLKDNPFTLDDMAACLCGNYDVSLETATGDAAVLLENWKENGLVTE